MTPFMSRDKWEPIRPQETYLWQLSPVLSEPLIWVQLKHEISSIKMFKELAMQKVDM